ncbi:MAG: ABC transporter permease [Endomicrobium sp.]|jgi:ABC-2 type transport system permease protein|nr:ABC transporter permease [Endomicrobium sp.]
MKFKNFNKIFIREFKSILKSKDMLLICIAAPLFYSLLFSFLYINRRASDIEVGVVNMDKSSTSRKLVRALNATPELKTISAYASSREALRDIFKDKINAFYFIPCNFSGILKKGQSILISDVVNSSNFLVANNVLKKITLTATAFTKKQFIKILSNKGYPYKSAEEAFSPIKINTVYLFNTQMNYSDFLLPCLLLAVLQQIILVAVCTNLASEKAKLNICKKAGLSFSSIFFGKTIPHILIGSIINFFNIFIILPINSIYAVSLFGLFTVSTAFIVAMVFFSVLISSLFRSLEMAMAALMFYSLPTVLLSGFAWPHNDMPVFLKIVSYFFPSTYSMNYVRMFILGDISIKYAIKPTINLILFAAVCFWISYLIESKTQRIFTLK